MRAGVSQTSAGKKQVGKRERCRKRDCGKARRGERKARGAGAPGAGGNGLLLGRDVADGYFGSDVLSIRGKSSRSLYRAKKNLTTCERGGNCTSGKKESVRKLVNAKLRDLARLGEVVTGGRDSFIFLKKVIGLTLDIRGRNVKRRGTEE